MPKSNPVSNPPSPAEDAVERVARAICINHGADPDGRSPQRRFIEEIDGVPTMLTDHMGQLWKMYVSDARVAIEAMAPAAAGWDEAMTAALRQVDGALALLRFAHAEANAAQRVKWDCALDIVRDLQDSIRALRPTRKMNDE